MKKLKEVQKTHWFCENHIRISDYKISSNQNNEKEYSATNTLSIDFALNNKVIEAFYQEIKTKTQRFRRRI
jgi:hypothetical protein